MYPDQIKINLDGDVADEAALVPAAMNMSVSDAVRLLMSHLAEQKALPVGLNTNAGIERLRLQLGHERLP